jgi:hypothetical protein
MTPEVARALRSRTGRTYVAILSPRCLCKLVLSLPDRQIGHVGSRTYQKTRMFSVASLTRERRLKSGPRPRQCLVCA